MQRQPGYALVTLALVGAILNLAACEYPACSKGELGRCNSSSCESTTGGGLLRL